MTVQILHLGLWIGCHFNLMELLLYKDMDYVCNIPLSAFGAIRDLEFHKNKCYVKLIYLKWHKFGSIVRYSNKKVFALKNESFLMSGIGKGGYTVQSYHVSKLAITRISTTHSSTPHQSIGSLGRAFL